MISSGRHFRDVACLGRWWSFKAAGQKLEEWGCVRTQSGVKWMKAYLGLS